ncbi:MAG: acyl carrier protein [Proteobacteria bacterium]|nr:acyl carrier protein [Pseudomonadota bacterium]
MSAEAFQDSFFGVMASMLKVPREQLARDTSRSGTEAWDSLRHMHLMLALEEEFGIEFSDGELADLATAGELLDAIAAKRAA